MFQCCGYINGYRDWGSRIPETCLCPSTNQVSDECEVVEDSLLKASGFSLDRLAYKQPCNIRKFWNEIILGLLGISFSIAALALIGMVLSMMFCLQTPRLPGARKVFSFNQPQYTPFYNLS